MKRWQVYQEHAAGLFQALGLEAKTDQRLVGARGSHDVDVVVRSQQAGLSQLWVVECKQHQRPVSKVHVAALIEIVDEIGADRGVLLSESGFQAGAVRMAHKTNITLTSLAELREDTAAELLSLRLDNCRDRLTLLQERIRAVGRTVRRGAGSVTTSYRVPPGTPSPVELSADIAIASTGLDEVNLGRWPAPYAWDRANDVPIAANDPDAFLAGLTESLAKLDEGIILLEAANKRTLSP